MRHLGTRTGIGLLTLALLFGVARPVRAQMVFDGNLLFENNASGNLAGQFVGASAAGAPCFALTAAQLGTVTYTHNVYADPLLPTAVYIPGVVPNFQPAVGSPAYGSALSVANTAWFPNADGFFTQTCYKGAIGPNPADDWTKNWTWWDSTGATQTSELHLARPLAIYDNVAIFKHQYFGPDSNYLVIGQLRVKSQGSLTVAPSVTIFEQAQTVGTVIIERGGQLWAIGNECEPITVCPDDVLDYTYGTHHTPVPFLRGDCGGVVWNGYGKTNQVNSCAGDSVASEGGAIGYWGGNDNNDCSGAIRYFRILFSGREVTPNNELNSFTWNGVGRNTHADYCEAYQGADDSFEWFGGQMDAKHLLGIDGTDDGYDWQMGTHNRAQFVIVRQSPGYAPALDQNGDKGIEADDNEYDYDATVCSGRSNCWISNMTIIGDHRVGAAFPGPTSGVNFRRGTGGTLINSIIYEMKTAALKVDDQATWAAHCNAAPTGPAVYCGTGTASTEPVANGGVFVAQGLPNPFRSQVAINFSLPKDSDVQVHIYSADGRLVKTLEDGATMSAGPHTLTWKIDRAVPTGMYFYRVYAGGQQITGKLVRID